MMLFLRFRDFCIKFLGHLLEIVNSCGVAAAFKVLLMSVFAIVPIKGLSASKRRLSSFLSIQDRRILIETMLFDVLTALKSSKIQQIVIVSSDLAVQSLADKSNVFFFSPSHNGLNPAIEEATAWCIQNHASSVLVVPGDIPFLRSEDVNRIIQLGTDKNPIVVLSPSNNGGTNALFQNPPNLVLPNFGHGSFAKHCNQAQIKGVCIKVYFSSAVALDIDSLIDLWRVLESPFNGYSKRFLQEMRFASEKPFDFKKKHQNFTGNIEENR
jgi:2-phospho-L-lactate guanylyltransferase